MKIQSISFKNYTKPIANNAKTPVSFVTQPVLTDTVSFKRKQELTPEEKYERAMDIVDSFSHEQIMHMDDFDQGHLEGIQYGLKSFEGMTFKEIYFLLSNIGELCVPLVRDCAGMCPVCAVNGLPKDRTNENLIHKMDFEDYLNFTHDLKAIRERLGFDLYKNIISKQSFFKLLSGYKPLTSLFYDSDCKDVRLEDKDGRVHEFPELNKMMYEASGLKGLFDTAGWSPTNSKVQKRMEDFAQYYSKPEHQNEIEQINISLNTYHGIMEKANQYKNKGDLEGYNRLKSVYVKNIANAMYTFTPLIDFEAYKILTKAFDEGEGAQFDDYKINVLENLMEEVFDALEKRYEEDLKNKNYKFVKNKKDISDLLNKVRIKSYDISTYFTPSARNNIFSKIPVENDRYFDESTPLKHVLADMNMFVDLNGKIYFQNDFEIYKTDRCFNFKNKDKETKQLFPRPGERVVSLKNRDFLDFD